MRFFAYILLSFICLVGKAQDNDILSVADSMPKFPGGNLGIGKFIQMNLMVPPEVREGSKGEKTFIKFIVDTLGKVLNPVVIKPSNYKSFDAEAIRVISEMPFWTPGLDKNKKVKVYMTLPVSYKNIGVVAAEPITEEHKNAMKYWNEGHKLEQQNKYDKALEMYTKSLSLEPQNKYAMFDKAKMHLALDEKNTACEIWTGMIQNNVRKDEAEEFVKKYCNSQMEAGKFSNELKGESFFNYGMDDVRNGRYEAAIRKFDSCLKYRPEHQNALFNKAMMHQKLDQKKQACAIWKRLLETSPEDKEVDDLLKINCY